MQRAPDCFESFPCDIFVYHHKAQDKLSSVRTAIESAPKKRRCGCLEEYNSISNGAFWKKPRTAIKTARVKMNDRGRILKRRRYEMCPGEFLAPDKKHQRPDITIHKKEVRNATLSPNI